MVETNVSNQNGKSIHQNRSLLFFEDGTAAHNVTLCPKATKPIPILYIIVSFIESTFGMIFRSAVYKIGLRISIFIFL